MALRHITYDYMGKVWKITIKIFSHGSMFWHNDNNLPTMKEKLVMITRRKSQKSCERLDENGKKEQKSWLAFEHAFKSHQALRN